MKQFHTLLRAITFAVFFIHPVIFCAAHVSPLNLYLLQHILTNNRLINAVYENNSEQVTLALNANADVNTKDINGCTPLLIATCNNNPEIIRTLLAYNADVNLPGGICNYTPLICTLLSNNANLAELLLENNADVNTIDTIGSTPLEHSAHLGNPELIALLLSYNAHVNPDPSNNITCTIRALELLKYIVTYPHKHALTKRLLDNHQSFFTPHQLLFAATVTSTPEIMQLLIESGARPDCLIQGHTPFSNSLHNKNNPKIKLLLSYLLPAHDTHRILSQIKKNERLNAHTYSIPLLESPLKLFQIPVNQQQQNDCAIHALANAAAIDQCLQQKKPVCPYFINKYQPHHYSYIAHKLRTTYPNRDIYNDGLSALDLIQIAKQLFKNDNCCVLTFSQSRPPYLYTTRQPADNLRAGIPDYSGPITHNGTLFNMIEKFKRKSPSSIHILCFMHFTSNRIPEDAQKNPNHCALTSFIKEYNKFQQPREIYCESNNCPLNMQPDAQRLINFINYHYGRFLAQ